MSTPTTDPNDLALYDLRALINGKLDVVTAQEVVWPLGTGTPLFNWAGDRIGYVLTLSGRMNGPYACLHVRARLFDGRIYKGRQYPSRGFVVLRRE